MKTKLALLLLTVLLPFGQIFSQDAGLSAERRRRLAVEGDIEKVTGELRATLKATSPAVLPLGTYSPETSRLKLSVSGKLRPGSVKIDFLKADNRIVSTLTLDSEGEVWTGDIGGAVSAKVKSTNSSNSLDIRIVARQIETFKSAPLSVTPPRATFMPFKQETVPERKDVGRSVVRIRFVGDDNKAYVCSGFLVGPNLLLTNEHCSQSEKEWRSSLIDFDYDSPDDAPVYVSRFSALIVSDPRLDYALLRLTDVPAGRTPLRLEDATVDGRDFYIIQHPSGRSKEVSVEDCKFVPRPNELVLDDVDFLHLCDTEGGSSGSPVVDKQSNRVVGLHHLGFDADVPQPEAFKVNRAVKVGLIIADIKKRKPSVATEMGF